MITMKFTPRRDVPVVKGEGLYDAHLAQSQSRAGYVEVTGFAVRARNAYEAERKFLFCLEEGLRGKTIDFDLEAALAERARKEKEAQDDGKAAEKTP